MDCSFERLNAHEVSMFLHGLGLVTLGILVIYYMTRKKNDDQTRQIRMVIGFLLFATAVYLDTRVIQLKAQNLELKTQFSQLDTAKPAVVPADSVNTPARPIGKHLGMVNVMFDGRKLEMEEFVPDPDFDDHARLWPAYACITIAGQRGVKYRTVYLAGKSWPVEIADGGER